MALDRIECAYCGDKFTDWDHLRPLVRNERPTGFINEIRNRVPACGPCNQSKSGSEWRRWIEGDAKKSPKSRQIKDLNIRIRRLEAFERWGSIKPLDLSRFVDPQIWQKHWSRLEDIHKKMRAAQEGAEIIRQIITTALRQRHG